MHYNVLSLTYKPLQTGHPFYLRCLLSLIFYRSSLITSHRSSNKPRLKYLTDRSIILLLLYGIDLRRLSHHFTSQLIAHDSPTSELSILFFVKKLKLVFSQFISSEIFIHPDIIRTDISGIDQASSFHLKLISLSLISISCTPVFNLFAL